MGLKKQREKILRDLTDAKSKGHIDRAYELLETLVDLSIPALGEDKTKELNKYREERKDMWKKEKEQVINEAEEQFSQSERKRYIETNLRTEKGRYVADMWKKISRIIVEENLVEE